MQAPHRSRNPRRSSALYVICCHSETRCGSLEAWSDDDAGNRYSRGSTHRMICVIDPSSKLATDAQFVPVESE
jgi:hypothetical protein